MKISLQITGIKPGGVLQVMIQLIPVGWVQFCVKQYSYSNLAMMISLQVTGIKPGGVLQVMIQLTSVGWVQFCVKQYSNLAYSNFKLGC